MNSSFKMSLNDMFFTPVGKVIVVQLQSRVIMDKLPMDSCTFCPDHLYLLNVGHSTRVAAAGD